MADVKISELPAATFVDSPDLVPIVQAGDTKKATVSLFQGFLKFIGLDFTETSMTFMNAPIPQTRGTLIVGKTYTILTYHSGDDFTNVGALANLPGQTFVATGTTPANWTNLSQLLNDSQGIWKSTGDSNDPVTHPYTPRTAGIIINDANNVEIGRMWFDDPVNRQNTFIGGLAGDLLTDTGTTNTGIGSRAFEVVQTIGQGNTGIGSKVFSTRSDTGSFNTLVGSLAHLADEGISNATGVGENVSVGDTSIAVGGVAEARGVGSITIGYLLTNNEDDSIAIGGYADVGNHTATIGSSTTTDFYANPLGTSILHGKGDAIVFPDSDPHIVGAAYWVAGALVRSAG